MAKRHSVPHFSDINHHINFSCAVTDGLLRFKCLHGGRRCAQRKANHGANIHAGIFEQLRRQLNVGWIHTNGGKMVGSGFVAKLGNLILGSILLEQRMVNHTPNVITCRAHTQSRCQAIRSRLHHLVHFIGAVLHARTIFAVTGCTIPILRGLL